MPLLNPSLPPRPSSSNNPRSKREPTFADCSRTTFTSGQTDWFHITTPRHFSNVDICLQCYNASFKNSQYAHCISKARPKPANVGTKCDFSIHWNRIAYCWLFMQNAQDLNLLGTVAEMASSDEGACPNLDFQDSDVQQGKKPTMTRTWYCLSDPDTGGFIEDLTVCSDCVERINIIFPCLKRIFQPVANGRRLQATCDLLTIGDGVARSQAYVNQILDLATTTIQTKTRDTRPLANYIKKWAPIPVCAKSKHVPQGATSYTFPTSMPNFAACLDCYTTHVLPLLESASPPWCLREMKPNVSPTGFVCDLYSPRLLQFFNEACASNDMATYRRKIMEREQRMQEYNLKLEQMRLQHQQFDRQAQLHR